MRDRCFITLNIFSHFNSFWHTCSNIYIEHPLEAAVNSCVQRRASVCQMVKQCFWNTRWNIKYLTNKVQLKRAVGKHELREKGSTSRFRSQECRILILQLLWNQKNRHWCFLRAFIRRPMQFLFPKAPAKGFSHRTTTKFIYITSPTYHPHIHLIYSIYIIYIFYINHIIYINCTIYINYIS